MTKVLMEPPQRLTHEWMFDQDPCAMAPLEWQGMSHEEGCIEMFLCRAPKPTP